MFILGNKNLPVEINIGSLKLRSTNLVELLGVKISNLSYSKHITLFVQNLNLGSGA